MPATVCTIVITCQQLSLPTCLTPTSSKQWGITCLSQVHMCILNSGTGSRPVQHVPPATAQLACLITDFSTASDHTPAATAPLCVLHVDVS